MSLYWLTQAVAYWSLVIFLVPKTYIKKLMLFAFLGGFVYTWIVQIFAVNIFQRWAFRPDVLMLYNIPVFFTLSWFAVTLIFGYLLRRYPKYQVAVVLFFILWAALMSYMALSINQIFFSGWSIPETLMFAIFSHVLLLYVFKYMSNTDELGANENMIKDSILVLKEK
ncbi:hypothetical protein [Dehalobacter restrictus]|uniref:Uncharacterized protein n=1 Tax=Dehalobacter restrictus TaxID=55583 RepID=A0A857DH83_9FIRM|nr:hypothetical protein [Dehalobacter restrictus]QHA00081.1 hypothetical protein GQ588_05180 [Dehalobacter restrictus]